MQDSIATTNNTATTTGGGSTLVRPFAQLFVTGSINGKRHVTDMVVDLHTNPFSIGRNQDNNNFVVNNPCVSQLHCVITKQNRYTAEEQDDCESRAKRRVEQLRLARQKRRQETQVNNNNDNDNHQNDDDDDHNNDNNNDDVEEALFGSGAQNDDGAASTNTANTINLQQEHYSNSLTVTLSDMSTNHVYVNDTLVGKGRVCHLYDGDEIHIVRAQRPEHSRYNVVARFACPQARREFVMPPPAPSSAVAAAAAGAPIIIPPPPPSAAAAAAMIIPPRPPSAPAGGCDGSGSGNNNSNNNDKKTAEEENKENNDHELIAKREACNVATDTPKKGHRDPQQPQQYQQYQHKPATPSEHNNNDFPSPLPLDRTLEKQRPGQQQQQQQQLQPRRDDDGDAAPPEATTPSRAHGTINLAHRPPSTATTTPAHGKSHHHHHHHHHQNNILLDTFPTHHQDTHISKEYTVDYNNTLGKGTFASVFRAVHNVTRTQVAVKEINKKKMRDQQQQHQQQATAAAANPGGGVNAQAAAEAAAKAAKELLKDRERQQREIEILCCVKHDHVVDCHAVFETDDYLWFVLGYAEGGELYKFLRDNHPVPEAVTRKMIYQVCHALHYLHGCGITHRDVKLENILLKFPVPRCGGPGVRVSEAVIAAAADRVHVQVSDFGLSRMMGTNNVALIQSLCGTPAYVAPEVVCSRLREDARGYTPSVDIFSLGVVAYALLAGRPPFNFVKDDATAAGGQKKSTKVAYETTVTWPRDCPASSEARSCVERMLRLQPENRPNAERLVSERNPEPWFADLRPTNNSRSFVVSATTTSKSLAQIGAQGDHHYIRSPQRSQQQQLLKQQSPQPVGNNNNNNNDASSPASGATSSCAAQRPPTKAGSLGGGGRSFIPFQRNNNGPAFRAPRRTEPKVPPHTPQLQVPQQVSVSHHVSERRMRESYDD